MLSFGVCWLVVSGVHESPVAGLVLALLLIVGSGVFAALAVLTADKLAPRYGRRAPAFIVVK
jgi:hypothetical protein